MTSIKILPNGMAQAVPPFKMTTKWGVTPQYKDFEIANPPLPYIGTATVREIVDGKQVNFVSLIK